MTRENKTLSVDGKIISIEGERNLLEVIRKANIDLPTFCYHSELSVYGACRLCLVEIQGRGIQAACSTPPEAGLVVRTMTEEIREIRKFAIELLLASHEQNCPTCQKSASCQLQALARRFGVEKVRFKPTLKHLPVDRSSPSLVRDPNKCILCGDCVRACSEIQGIGAIDFAFRGAAVAVLPSFGKDLSKVECINCGQCARVCPTGALAPHSEIERVWKDLDNKKKKVVAQIAPAVRVALGEYFGQKPGAGTTGRIAAALKAMGFAAVYDTAFAADLTVIEEGTEFLERKKAGKSMPLITSCCPAWVKYAEQYYPHLLPNLSSCKSPQQMLGSLMKKTLPEKLGVAKEDLVVVSIMPCTAKKYEAKLPKFAPGGIPDVDHVITTTELALMIEGAGLQFNKLEPESLDMPFGFKTGAGVIFGSTGGVTEAVLRFAWERVASVKLEAVDFKETRGEEGIRELNISMNDLDIRVAIVNGLANAKVVMEKIRAGICQYDFIEVMACPGGCVGGAGQPAAKDRETRQCRAKGLYETDKTLQLHKAQDNYFVTECYEKTIGKVGGHEAHQFLHTEYQNRKRISDEDIALTGNAGAKLRVSVCLGTSCFLRGAQNLLTKILEYLNTRGLENQVEIKANFCFEKCDRGPTITVGEQVIERCTLEKATTAIEEALKVSVKE